MELRVTNRALAMKNTTFPDYSSADGTEELARNTSAFFFVELYGRQAQTTGMLLYNVQPPPAQLEIYQGI